jgi:hypothetical protein
MKMLWYAVVIALAFAQTAPTYVKLSQFANADCTGFQFSTRAIKTSCSTTSAATCVSGLQTSCVSGLPATFQNAIQATLNTASDCTDSYPQEQVTLANGICFQSGGDSWTAGCYYGLMSVYNFPYRLESFHLKLEIGCNLFFEVRTATEVRTCGPFRETNAR